jgi:hypothetical protein
MITTGARGRSKYEEVNRVCVLNEVYCNGNENAMQL